ncbi:hypothetical protein SBV1_gp46 [Sulfolobales Beppu virus 1]|nr:hypothetical protein SBV1_gp46 [Sulfolobales Beppu virus 1]
MNTQEFEQIKDKLSKFFESDYDSGIHTIKVSDVDTLRSVEEWLKEGVDYTGGDSEVSVYEYIVDSEWSKKVIVNYRDLEIKYYDYMFDDEFEDFDDVDDLDEFEDE